MTKTENAYWACFRFVRDYIFEPIWYRIFGHKHHIVRLNLKPSPWYDTDTKILYAVMGLVEWFVENDMMDWEQEDRDREIERINKEESEEDKKDFIDCLREQWARDDGVKEIHKWWKNYPNRQKEITDALNAWADYGKKLEDEDDFMAFFNRKDKMNEEQIAEEEKLFKIHRELEVKLLKEEDEMLKKAIELRGSMWS